jgi:hypothetical protein
MYPKCPECKSTITGLGGDYDGTVQCDKCAKIIHVVIRRDIVVHVAMRSIFLEIPEGLPTDLRTILDQASSCYEIGSNAAAVVLAGLFVEGLLKEIGLDGDRLFDMIEQAHQDKIVSTLGYHVATASRLMRNIGAHYSPELAQLSRSDARLVLEMARKLASDVAASGKIKGTDGA